MIAALDQPFLRYVLELIMVLPASILCLLPLRRYFALPPLLVVPIHNMWYIYFLFCL